MSINIIKKVVVFYAFEERAVILYTLKKNSSKNVKSTGLKKYTFAGTPLWLKQMFLVFEEILIFWLEYF